MMKSVNMGNGFSQIVLLLENNLLYGANIWHVQGVDYFPTPAQAKTYSLFYTM